MTSSWPPKSTFWAFWAMFCRFSPIWPLWNRNFPIKPWQRLFTILRRSLWNNIFPDIYHHFGLMTSSWPPKCTFREFLTNFSDFRLFDHCNMKIILSNYGRECSQYSGDYFKKKNSKNIPLFWQYDVILTPKRSFGHFEQILRVKMTS